jgi:hypothetical protein
MEVPMFAILNVVESQENEKLLCFVTVSDAKRFKEFCDIYWDEGGCGNGYGAYVCSDDEITEVKKVPTFASIEIQNDLIESMSENICEARLVDQNSIPGFTLGTKNGAITFNFEFNKLPPQQRPTKGDMFRIPKSRLNKELEEVEEGRVIEDRGEKLLVISSWDEGDNGLPSKNAKQVEIDAKKTMKISDWLSENRRKK